MARDKRAARHGTEAIAKTAPAPSHRSGEARRGSDRDEVVAEWLPAVWRSLMSVQHRGTAHGLVLEPGGARTHGITRRVEAARDLLPGFLGHRM